MQEFTITTPEGIKLAAMLSLPEHPRALVIGCHGFRGAKENGGRIFNLAQKLCDIGAGLMVFDFQGSGKSEGEFKTVTLTRQVRDLEAVLDYARNSFKLPVFLLGRSFGGATVLAGAVLDDSIAGYVFWSTPVFLKETFGVITEAGQQPRQSGTTLILSDEGGSYELAYDLFIDFGQHDMEKYIQLIRNKPVLIVHGQADQVVAPGNAEYLAHSLPRAVMYMVEGADHRFTRHTAEREDLTVNWLSSCLTKIGNHPD